MNLWWEIIRKELIFYTSLSATKIANLFFFYKCYIWSFEMCCRRVVQIIDCCKYLAKQNPNCDLRSMVTLLTKIQVSSSISVRAKEILAKAIDEGISLFKVFFKVM